MTALLAGALGVAGVGLVPAVASADPVDVVVTAGSADAAARAVTGLGGEVTASLDFLGGVAATVPTTARGRPAVPTRHRGDPGRGRRGRRADLAPRQRSRTTSRTRTSSRPCRSPSTGRPRPGPASASRCSTPVSPRSPELEGRVVRGPDLSGDGDGIDHHGHGTFMAGLIAADGRVRDEAEPRFGVAPGAHVVSVKLAGRDGRTTMSRVLEGIGWAITNQDEHGIRVLSLSLGVPTNRAPQADPLALAVDAAWASGLTVVTASGNEAGQGHLAGPRATGSSPSAPPTPTAPRASPTTPSPTGRAPARSPAPKARRARARRQHRLAPRPGLAASTRTTRRPASASATSVAAAPRCRRRSWPAPRPS